MKTFWKTEDRAIDNLLRGRKGEQTASASCREFDPDLATAYIEHCLTPAEQTRYEQHISLCASCRTSVVALARMAQAEPTASIVSLASSTDRAQAGWLYSLKGFFIGLARPQVAMAAVAVIALAVSLPIILSRKESARNEPVATPQAERQELAKAIPASPVAAQESSPVALDPNESNGAQREARTRTVGNSAGAAAGATVGPDDSRRQTEEAAVKMPAEQQPAPAVTGALASADVQKNEVKSEPVAAKSESRSAQEKVKESDAAPKPTAPAPKQEAPKELAKIDPEEARRLKKEDKDSVSMTHLKSGRPDVDRSKDRTATIRPEDSVAPPSSSSRDESGRRSGIASDRPGRAFREGESRAATPKRGTPDRKAGGKRFYLLNDVWTDKDYKPEKELPVVTIVRDSDLYRELLAKRPGLKVYFTRFVENERAIIVYKDTVYRLDPPEK